MKVKNVVVLEAVPWAAVGPGWANSGIRAYVRKIIETKDPDGTIRLEQKEEWEWFHKKDLSAEAMIVFKLALEANNHIVKEAQRLVMEAYGKENPCSDE